MQITKKHVGIALAVGIAAVLVNRIVSTAPPQSTATPTPTPLPVPYPGFWHTGLNAHFYPCSVTPYAIYNQPDTGAPSYVRYDYQVALVSNTVNQPAGQGGACHCYQSYDNLGRVIPIAPQVMNPGYFPPPTDLMRNPPLGFPYDAFAYWAAKNPGATDTHPSESLYAVKIASHSEWISGNIPAFQLAKLQQCAVQGPTRTATPVPITAVPTTTPAAIPTPCPTCVPREVTRIVVWTPTVTAQWATARPKP